ncbi:hypothetical protein KF840_16150 [bacterium]|nr:hypothetical protein [bacterium]
METAYITAFAALAGSTIGGLTSLTATWLAQRFQFRAQQLAHDIARREDLYKDFINEASRCYSDALQRHDIEVAALVRVYALVSRMRILSSPALVEQADNVVRLIMETYAGPNRPIAEVVGEVRSGTLLDPLRDFSDACREELRRGVVIPRLHDPLQ